MRRRWDEKNNKVGFMGYDIVCIRSVACVPKVKQEELWKKRN